MDSIKNTVSNKEEVKVETNNKVITEITSQLLEDLPEYSPGIQWIQKHIGNYKEATREIDSSLGQLEKISLYYDRYLVYKKDNTIKTDIFETITRFADQFQGKDNHKNVDITIKHESSTFTAKVSFKPDFINCLPHALSPLISRLPQIPGLSSNGFSGLHTLNKIFTDLPESFGILSYHYTNNTSDSSKIKIYFRFQPTPSYRITSSATDVDKKAIIDKRKADICTAITNKIEGGNEKFSQIFPNGFQEDTGGCFLNLSLNELNQPITESKDTTSCIVQ